MLCCIDDSNHANSVMQKLSASRENKESCDLRIRVSGKDIYAHRNVLSVSSDYFKAMLKHETIEKQNGVVNMEDIQYEAVRNCIDFVYTGKLSIPLEKCESHLHAASLMQLNEVCQEILKFLSKEITVKTFFEIKKLADKYESEELDKACDDYAATNLKTLSLESSFGQLQCEYITDLLSSGRAKIILPSDEKLKIILSWIKADIQNREKFLTSLASTVELGNISAEYGKLLATTEPLCYENAQFMTSLYLAHLMVNTTDDEAFDEGFQYLMVTFTKDGLGMRTCRIEDEEEDEWIGLDDMDVDIACPTFAATVVKGDVYVVCTSQKVLKLKISDLTGKWVDCPELIHAHGPYLKCVNHANQLYVAGNKHMERYDNTELSCYWKEIPVPYGSCDRSAIVSLDDFVYIIGGLDCGIHPKMWRYRARSQSWITTAAMHFARATPGACAYGGNIYVAGGYVNGAVDSFEQYEPLCNQWTVLPNMLCPRSPVSLVTVGKRIIVCGTNKTATTVDEYDPKKKTWSSLGYQFSRAFVAAATFPVREDILNESLSTDIESFYELAFHKFGSDPFDYDLY